MVAGDDVDIKFICPVFNLLVRRCAKGVTCTNQQAVSFVLIQIAELGGSGSFARSIDADQANYLGLILSDDHRSFSAFKHACENCGANLSSFLAADFFVGFVGDLDFFDYFFYSLDAKVGGVERFFELVERILVQFSTRKDILKSLVKSGGLALEPLFEFIKETTHSSNELVDCLTQWTCNFAFHLI